MFDLNAAQSSVNAQLVTAVSTVSGVAIAGGISYLVSGRQIRSETERRIREAKIATQEKINILSQSNINPLRYWATLVRRRFNELEAKVDSHEYGQVQRWFQQIKNHADTTEILADFPYWASYEGVFAVTTLYWTCNYLRASRDVVYISPFNWLNSRYDDELRSSLADVGRAFGGIWDSNQEVLAEFIGNRGSAWDYQGLCRILDNHNKFEIAPLLKPIDYFITDVPYLQKGQIGKALDALIQCIDSRPAPELAESFVRNVSGL